MGYIRTFTDHAGRTRTITVDTYSIARCETEIGVSTSDIYTGKLIEKLRGRDAGLLGRMLYLFTGADEAGEDAKAFAAAVAPEIDTASQELVRAMLGFFDLLTDGAASRIGENSLETWTRTIAVAEKQSSPPSEEKLEELVSEFLQTLRSGRTSTTPPASSGSTPDLSPTASSSPCPEPEDGTTGT